jgi:predicted N-acyltransferase
VSLSTRIITEFASIDQRAWSQLEHGDNPFVSHAFLQALETSGSLEPQLGWLPHHLALYEDGELAAFAPTYIKSNSHGEFVFDWAWADAYHRHGLNYYPKLLTAVPYSPVTGPRLLTRRGHPRPDELRRGLIALAQAECEKEDYSTWHCNFTVGGDQEALAATGHLQRHDWQFHWRNRGYRTFDDFLSQLRSRKRKNIRRERRQVHEADIRFDWKTGNDVSQADLDLIFGCYTSTFHAYGNHPALNREFFACLARGLGDQFLVSIASDETEPLAMSLFLAGGGRLYGRYWGSTVDIPGLHFEAAYYQGIEHCIRNGIEVFESGAQGQHKISRGFTPEKTTSAHHVRNGAFRNAIGDFLRRESAGLEAYRDQLSQHDPYRRENT